MARRLRRWPRRCARSSTPARWASIWRTRPVATESPSSWSRSSARAFAPRVTPRAAGTTIVINARTDVYLRAVGDPTTRFAQAVQRLNAYHAAGADCLFAPTVDDADTIAGLVQALDGPLNIMVGPGSLPINELRRLGVARVSLGGSLALGALGFVQRTGRDLLERGAYEALEGGLTYADLGALLTPVIVQ
jgi:2-methylisocitrate lyase-like PEP mutase family enzyme